jgi:hypothetical protein
VKELGNEDDSVLKIGGQMTDTYGMMWLQEVEHSLQELLI